MRATRLQTRVSGNPAPFCRFRHGRVFGGRQMSSYFLPPRVCFRPPDPLCRRRGGRTRLPRPLDLAVHCPLLQIPLSAYQASFQRLGQKLGRVGPWRMPTSPEGKGLNLLYKMSPACHRHRPSAGARLLVVAVAVALNVSAASLLATATALPRSRWVAAPSRAGRVHDSNAPGHDQPAVAVAAGVRCGATGGGTSSGPSKSGDGSESLEVRRGCRRRLS